LFQQFSPVVRESLRQAGIEVTERIIDFNLLQSKMRDHDYDASLLRLSSDIISDQYQIWHSSSANGGTNFANFKNPDSDTLLEQIRQEFDPEKRKQLNWKWQELIADQQPFTFLYYEQAPAAYSKRFQNVQWLPLRPGYDLMSWWVPKSQQKYGKQNGQ